MKIASTRKSLLIVIFLLLIIDVVVLFFFVSKNKPEYNHQRDRKEGGLYTMLTKEANFTPEQMAKYQELREEQFKNIKPLFGKIRKSKDNFYSLLYLDNVPDSTVNALSDSIALNQKAVDIQMFTYFQKIRALCTAEQIPKFDSSIKNVVMRMTGRQGTSGRQKSDSLKDRKQTHPNNNH
jgi:Spy/CpxP family protein refolding chaperone